MCKNVLANSLIIAVLLLGVPACNITQGTEPALPIELPFNNQDFDYSTAPFSENDTLQSTDGAGICNNNYWPITENAYWEYHVSYLGAGTWDGSEFNEIWTTELINSSNGKTTFTINIDTDLGRGGPIHYYCDSTGIYKEDPSGWLLVLPPEGQIAIGNSFNTSWGEPLTMNGINYQSTNFGDIQLLDTQTGVAVEYSIFRSFAHGIGMYSESINTDTSQEQRILFNYGGIDQAHNPSNTIDQQDQIVEPTSIPDTAKTTGPTTMVVYDEARVRYILTDIQLSGLDGYYRGFPKDSSAMEAIERWDAGIRVINIDQFERKIVGSWQIVYVGTATTINGMDVVLSSDTNDSENPMRIWIASINGCRVNINGVLLYVQGPWNWYWGDGTEQVGWFPQTHTYSQSGSYTITVTSNRGDMDSLGVEVICQ